MRGVLYIKPKPRCTASIMPQEVFHSLIGYDPEQDRALSSRRVYSSRSPTAEGSRILSTAWIDARPVLFEGDRETGVELYKPSDCLNAASVRKPSAAFQRHFARHRDPNSHRTIYLLPENRALITGDSFNSELVEHCKSLKSGYFCNTNLMTQIAHLHRTTFGESEQFVDLFLGHGGSTIAGIALGYTHLTGIEIEKENIWSARANIERFIDAIGAEYEESGTNDEHTYTLQFNNQTHTIRIIRANSLELSPRDIADLGIGRQDVISDIPWGPKKCLAVGKQGVAESSEDMRWFEEDLETHSLLLKAHILH